MPAYPEATRTAMIEAFNHARGGRLGIIAAAAASGRDVASTRSALYRWGLLYKTGAHKNWTTTEQKRLCELMRAGKSMIECARIMDRTYHSIVKKATLLELTGRVKIPWTRGQMKVVERAADQMVPHLMMTLGRSEGAIRNKLVTALTTYPKRVKRNRIVRAIEDAA